MDEGKLKALVVVDRFDPQNQGGGERVIWTPIGGVDMNIVVVSTEEESPPIKVDRLIKLAGVTPF